MNNYPKKKKKHDKVKHILKQLAHAKMLMLNLIKKPNVGVVALPQTHENRSPQAVMCYYENHMTSQISNQRSCQSNLITGKQRSVSVCVWRGMDSAITIVFFFFSFYMVLVF